MGVAFAKGGCFQGLTSLFRFRKTKKNNDKRPSLTYNEIYSDLNGDYYRKKPKDTRKPDELPKAIEPPSVSTPEVEKKKLSSPFFNRMREIKTTESQLQKQINQNKPDVKGIAQAVMKKDYPLRKPSMIDCGTCMECSLIKKDIDVPARNRQIKIKKIINLYSESSYVLKKKEYKMIYGKRNIKETLMYHGTKLAYVKPIVRNNFNWRLFGKCHGHVFGKGISFTVASDIAEAYCDQRSDVKCMFVSKVLAARASFGNRNTDFPDVMRRCDSTVSPRKSDKVMVKYRDDEFLPTHVVFFTDTDMDEYHFNSIIENEGRDFTSR